MSLKLVISSLLWLPLLLPSFSNADVTGITASRAIMAAAKKIVEPSAKLSCAMKFVDQFSGLDHYDADVNIELGNYGAEKFTASRLRCSPRLQESTKQFYIDNGKMVRGLTGDELKALPKTEVLEGRPSLLDEAGSGRFANIQSNSIYEKALAVSGGSPSRAIEVLAICGNDDVEMPIELPGMTWSKQKNDRRQAEQKLELVRINMVKTTNPANATFLSDALKSLRTVNEGPEGPQVPIRFTCPGRTSPLYVPGAVGPKLDKRLIDRIVKAQAPTKGGRALPAKNYHTILGAYFGCKLSQCGLSETTVSELQKLYARTYRTVRLMNNVSRGLRQAHNVSESQDEHIDSPDISGMGNEVDASLMFKSGDYDVETLLDEDPYFQKNLPAGRSRPQQSLCRRPGWSDRRCKLARARLAGWLIDLDWTAAAQSAGAAWGHQKCKDEVIPEAAEEAACMLNPAKRSSEKSTTVN